MATTSGPRCGTFPNWTPPSSPATTRDRRCPSTTTSSWSETTCSRRTIGPDPGEELSGSHAATEFVAWYNGHPDFKDHTFDLSHPCAVVIGVGNVAVDVARILCRDTEELARTDIADYALDCLRRSRVREVYLLGRRGPAQAAFTNPEAKELGELVGVEVSTLPSEDRI